MERDISFFTPVYIECRVGESLTWQADVVNFAEYMFGGAFDRSYFLEPENLTTTGKKVVFIKENGIYADIPCSWRCVQALAFTVLFPVGLFALAVKAYHHWDGFINRPYNPLPYQPSSLEPKIVTEYRPDFSVKPDDEGRLKPTYLVQYFKEVNGEYLYEEVHEIGWKSHTSAATPLDLITKEITPNRFFTLCEGEDFKDYKLHHAMSRMGMNAFTIAAYRGNIELLEALIETAPDLVDLENEQGLTPLMFACMHADQEIAVEMANLLIENGADVNLSTTVHYGRTYPETIGKDRIPVKSTPLYIATLHNNDMLVDLLLKNGATLDHNEETGEETLEEDEGTFDYKEETSKEIITIQEKYSIPNINPMLYNLTDEHVKYLFDLSSNVTWEKCMPLAAWKKENSVVPDDIIDLICQIYKRVTIFWR